MEITQHVICKSQQYSVTLVSTARSHTCNFSFDNPTGKASLLIHLLNTRIDLCFLDLL